LNSPEKTVSAANTGSAVPNAVTARQPAEKQIAALLKMADLWLVFVFKISSIGLFYCPSSN
jgi:hypothetical protein